MMELGQKVIDAIPTLLSGVEVRVMKERHFPPCGKPLARALLLGCPASIP